MLSSPHDGQAADSNRKPLHILATEVLSDDHVLVRYSNGSAAIFEAEELEKLRPVPKQIFARAPDERIVSMANPSLTVTPTSEPEQPMVLGAIA